MGLATTKPWTGNVQVMVCCWLFVLLAFFFLLGRISVDDTAERKDFSAALPWVIKLFGSVNSTAEKQSHSSIASIIDGKDPLPFYIPPAQSEFRRIAGSVQPVTDKIGATSIVSNAKHTYDTLYSKYFEPDGRRFRKLKVLEIGLGCNMNYGAGASAKVWKQYLPNAEIWFGEYDQKCIQQYSNQVQELGVRVVTGDQADNATLARWVQETGGDFDVIIDDGGHYNHQIFNSFATLWYKALKPGGVYFIEDLRFSREGPWRGAPGSPVMAEVISDWVNSVMAVIRFGRIQDLQDPEVMKPSDKAYRTSQQLNSHAGDSGYLPVWKLPLGAKTVECAAEMCAIVKCTATDALCPDGLGSEAQSTTDAQTSG